MPFKVLGVLTSIRRFETLQQMPLRTGTDHSRQMSVAGPSRRSRDGGFLTAPDVSGRKYLSPRVFPEPTLASFAAREPGLELGDRGGGGPVAGEAHQLVRVDALPG